MPPPHLKLIFARSLRSKIPLLSCNPEALCNLLWDTVLQREVALIGDPGLSYAGQFPLHQRKNALSSTFIIATSATAQADSDKDDETDDFDDDEADTSEEDGDEDEVDQGDGEDSSDDIRSDSGNEGNSFGLRAVKRRPKLD